MRAWWTCARCTKPIEGEDPHSDPATGEDLHEACCPACTPGLDPDLNIVTAVVHTREQLGIAGHPGPTSDQAARGEAAARGAA